jgi:hypothetical protein
VGRFRLGFRCLVNEYLTHSGKKSNYQSVFSSEGEISLEIAVK